MALEDPTEVAIRSAPTRQTNALVGFLGIAIYACRIPHDLIAHKTMVADFALALARLHAVAVLTAAFAVCWRLAMVVL